METFQELLLVCLGNGPHRSVHHSLGSQDETFFPLSLRIEGFPWSIHVCRNDDPKIGCERKKLHEWQRASEREILELGGKRGLKLWQQYKEAILAFARGHNKVMSDG